MAPVGHGLEVRAHRAQAREVCASCSVPGECLRAELVAMIAAGHEGSMASQFGGTVVAGMTPAERVALLRQAGSVDAAVSAVELGKRDAA